MKKKIYSQNQNTSLIDTFNNFYQFLNTIQGGPISNNPAYSSLNPILQNIKTGIDAFKNQLMELQQQQQEQMQQIDEISQGLNNIQSSKKVFNFKISQRDESAFFNNDEEEGEGEIYDEEEGEGEIYDEEEGEGEIHDEEEHVVFSDSYELKEHLEKKDRIESENFLLPYIDNPSNQEIISSTLESFYEHDLNPEEKLELIAGIWDIIPNVLKSIDSRDNYIEVNAMNKKNINSLVKSSTSHIEKLAQLSVKKNSYNLTKTAQHDTRGEIVMWGPESRRIDPFTGQYVSDWHIVERNKGWGFRIGDLWNIDFESLWRENIMDKYSRPYKDQDGNWVGGYIEKRFETDKWIPETNNMQLKPGERRKPRPVELGSYEARLESYRGNKKDVFNWKEASSIIQKKK